MKKRILIIITIVIICLIILNNIRLNINSATQSKLQNFDSALGIFLLNMEKHIPQNNEVDYKMNNTDTSYNKIIMENFLETSKGFGVLIGSYNEIHIGYFKQDYKEQKNISNFRKLINNYFDVFVDAVKDPEDVDYDALTMIYDDFSKFFEWLENNYQYKDNQGYTVYEKFSYKDMVDSGLIEKFKVEF